ncbi:hypothetical protein RGF97_04980 [Streptomyces roseicoloratus]|uniref:Uncharacterized protein n=1 Tax=Streptomyces roseicoloratus TaxID=2508722 RepID=A0ABY9RQ64_9ACTN|nr:hypothetical protein [Streptomyces roseicoloratus]WMX44336.1 hypothetical protein RGF97_04980 [Streptomyces roseicoloratus]
MKGRSDRRPCRGLSTSVPAKAVAGGAGVTGAVVLDFAGEAA